MQRPDTVQHYLHCDYLDPGEKALYAAILPEAKGKPLLDIGVGGGRTVDALTAISADYTAIDYAKEMVQALARRRPSLRILHADARDMSMFQDGSMFLVVFSCAGIDMVDAADRLRVLREVLRVLAPGGAFIFSTHNLECRRREREPTLLDIFLPLQRSSFSRVRNFLALRKLVEKKSDWAILNSKYHAYSTLMHYITMRAQRAQLEEVGFAPGAVAYSNEGELISGNGSDSFMLHFMARAPVRAGSRGG